MFAEGPPSWDSSQGGASASRAKWCSLVPRSAAPQKHRLWAKYGPRLEAVRGQRQPCNQVLTASLPFVQWPVPTSLLREEPESYPNTRWATGHQTRDSYVYGSGGLGAGPVYLKTSFPHLLCPFVLFPLQ